MDANFPTYLDPGSFGVAVYSMQQLLHRLDPELSPNTLSGVHSGPWLTYVTSLQMNWNIETDGGMGPVFRQTLSGKYGINFEKELALYKGGTVCGGPRGWTIHTSQCQSFPAIHNSLNLNVLSSVIHLVPWKTLLHGGDGGNRQRRVDEDRLNIVRQTTLPIPFVLLFDCIEEEQKWWKEEARFTTVSLLEDEALPGQTSLRSALSFLTYPPVVVSRRKDILGT